MTGAGTEGEAPSALGDVLRIAREVGFLGPGPIEPHLRHAQGFTTLVRRALGPGPAQLLDLGSGAGLPGLVIATELPAVTMILLEANERRAGFLEQAIRQCELVGRVKVVHARAEMAGRDQRYRGTFDGVVARSFGAPAVVAECAAPLLRVGGWLIVSEPPGDEDGPVSTGSDEMRWPADQLVQFGLEPVESVRSDFGYQLLRQYQLCREEYPRRDGVPSKRPRF